MASSDVFQEIGRLKQKVEYLSEEIQALRRQRDVLDRANQQVHEELAATAARARRAEAGLVSVSAENEKLREQIARQQRTIKVQSDQIASPNDKRRGWTTQRTAPPASFGGAAQQPPSSTDLSSLSKALDRQDTQPTSSPPTKSLISMPPPPPPPPPARAMTKHKTPVKTRESPAPSSRLETPSQPATSHHETPRMARRVESPSAAQGRKPGTSSGSSMPLSLTGRQTHGQDIVQRQRTEDKHIDLITEFSQLFNSTERWTYSYCNAPDKNRDRSIPSALRDRIATQTNPAIVSALMSSGTTRYLAVDKLINSEIVRICFRQAVLQGFRPSFDEHFSKLRAQHSSSLPIHVRRALLTTSVKIAQEACGTPGFQEWMEERVQEHAMNMWRGAESLLADKINHEKAWSELTKTWRHAYRIGFLMLKRASIFHADFPPVGPNSHFNSSNMVCREPTCAGIPPAQLATMGLKVRLAFTPAISETDFSGERGTVPKYLHFANVLVQT